MGSDHRWVRRFGNYQKALPQLDDAVALMAKRALSDLEKLGVIQAFEFTYELGWNVLKDYLVWQGIENIVGSRDTIREAFKRGLIAEGHVWMAMLQDRNRTVHTYNEQTANEIISNIQQQYLTGLKALEKTFIEISDEQG